MDRLDAVHIRHPPVEDDNVVAFAFLAALLDLFQRFPSASGAVGGHAERLERVDSRIQKDLVVVDDQDVHRFEHHIVSLPVRDGQIQDHGKRRAFSLFALAVDGASHQVDHLLCDGKSEAGALDAVHTAVRLARERLVHIRHKLRGHADAGIGDLVGQPHAAGFRTLFLMQVHADPPAGFGVFDGVGEDVDVDLIQPELVCVKIFSFDLAGAEIEVDVLFLDHRLRQVYEIFHRLDDGERQRAEGQLSALDLGDVQDIVDQGEQVIAGHRDLPQILPDRFRIAEILFRDRRQADDRVHRRADIVGHRRQEIRLRPVCRRCFHSRRLEFLVVIEHDRHVEQEQDQQTGGNKTDQPPVLRIDGQVFHRHQAEERPSSRRFDRGVGEDAFLPAGVVHEERTGRRSDVAKELLRRSRVQRVVRLVKLEETGIFIRMAFDDIVAVRIDDGRLGASELFLREDPFLRQFRQRQDAQQDGAAGGAGQFVMERDVVAESDGLFAVDRVRIGAGNVDRFPYVTDPADVVQKICPLIGDRIIVRPGVARSRGQTGQRILIHDVRGGVLQHVRIPDEGNGFFDGHALAVDIVGPDVADALLAFEIILRDVFHRDRGVLEVFDLPLGRDPAGRTGIRDHKEQHCDHDKHIDDDDPGFFHSVFRSSAETVSPSYII